MMARLKTFAERLALGRESEWIVREALLRSGYWIIDTNDYTTAKESAPIMHARGRGLPIPDFACFKHGDRCWCDVKAKTSEMLFRKTNRVEFRLEQDDVHRYLEFQQETSAPIWIIFHEKWTNTFLCGQLSVLLVNARFYDGPKTKLPVYNVARHECAVIDITRDGCLDLMIPSARERGVA